MGIVPSLTALNTSNAGTRLPPGKNLICNWSPPNSFTSLTKCLSISINCIPADQTEVILIFFVPAIESKTPKTKIMLNIPNKPAKKTFLFILPPYRFSIKVDFRFRCFPGFKFTSFLNFFTDPATFFN